MKRKIKKTFRIEIYCFAVIRVWSNQVSGPVSSSSAPRACGGGPSLHRLAECVQLSPAKTEFMSSRSRNFYWIEIKFYLHFIYLIKCWLSPYKYKALDEVSHSHTQWLNTLSERNCKTFLSICIWTTNGLFKKRILIFNTILKRAKYLTTLCLWKD